MELKAVVDESVNVFTRYGSKYAYSQLTKLGNDKVAAGKAIHKHRQKRWITI